MPIIHLTTAINAPREICFDLSISVDFHVYSGHAYGEEVVGNITSGLLTLGDNVTWHARQFGVWQYLTSKITAFDRPHHFRDTMQKGAFKRFDHDHNFECMNGSTIMTDAFDYESPFGPVGRIADLLILEKHMRRLLETRNRQIKAVAESGEWRKFFTVSDLL